MIRNLIIQVILFITVCPNKYGQTDFDNYYYVGNPNLQSECVITRSDSGYSCVNYVQDSSTGRIDANLIWINKSGSQIKNRSLNYFNQSQLTFMQGKNHFNEFTKSSYLLQGVCEMGQMQGLLLLKFNQVTLDTVKTYAHPDINNSYAINNFIKIRENKYFLIGNKGNSANSVVIFQIDSNLNVTNQMQVGVPSNFVNYNAIYNYNTNQILLGGNLVGGGKVMNALVLIDTLGAISQSLTTTYGFHDNAAQYEFSASDTTYITYGSQTITTIGNYALSRLCITKYDRFLNLKWQKTYGQKSLQNCLISMVVENDGSIVATGGYSETTSLPFANENQNGVILKVSKDGNFRWMREFDHFPAGNLFEKFYGIDKTKENGYVVCGSISNQKNGVVWFVKTDSTGCVTSGCPSSTVQVDSLINIPNYVFVDEFDIASGVSIYPNPSNGNLKIRVSEIGKGVISYSVKNTLGITVVSSKAIDEIESDLNIIGADGIYYVEFKHIQLGKVQTKRVVKMSN